MTITYDTTADALYMRMTSMPVASTVPAGDTVMLDMDEEGNIVGVEMLRISQQQSLLEDLLHEATTGVPVSIVSGKN